MADRWRVAFDAGPARPEPAGVGVYVHELGTALRRLDPAAIALIGLRRDSSLAAAGDRAASTPFRGRNHQLWLHRHADVDARRVGATLAHYTNGTAPVAARVPFVLTIHDLSVLRHPRYHPPLRVATAPLTVFSAARARAIVVPSEASRREVRRLLHVAARRLVVVSYAPRERQPADAPATEALMRRLGLQPGRYVLAVGTLEPRKNQRRLMAAFEMLADEDADLRLVLVGSPGWRSDGVREFAATSRHRDRIVIEPWLPDPELESLLRSAGVAAYVSLYEGYGLPVIEAMAAGVPVVTSARSSMPEVAGGAAVLVDPLDVGAIATGLRDAFARREHLSAAGRARAAPRSWLDVAAEMQSIYRWAARAAAT